ncbi:glycosyl transferase group 1 [Chlorobium limicola DSM 245]|uniref:Glycosyl transferase group 1 n=1 Tax=Chlorobium limicola (strain DSM 245 / NBRC 103803 / 6330) TaxID=290315 RepID=B3EHE3_CHLL2|nr:glycosyltransferase family 4 protein [Chlorobium limicola]ACD91305.1 glycosyl transferase group 1 [Chlorobium limicola DSM 245]
MRIAFISPFFPLKGGISRFSGLLADELQVKGHAVRRLGFKKLYPSFLTGGHAPEVPEYRSAANGGDAVIVLYNPLTWLTLLRDLKRERPEVLLVAYWTGLLAPLLFAVRKLSGIRTVVLLHNLSTHEPFMFEPFLQKLLLASADGFITLSREVAGALAAAGNAKPVVQLYHPPYPPFPTFSGSVQPEKSEARHTLGYDAEAPVLLFFGYVRRYKGLDLLLRAMPAILAVWPEARLLVAGQFYEPEATFRELIGRLGIGESVDLRPGYSSDRDAACYFAAADAAVLPYRQASQSGVVQLACGYGLPVIVTPAGGLAAEVEQGRTGWIAGDLSSEAIAAAVIGFLGDPRRPAMPQSVREYAAGHSWERFAGEAGSFIQSVAKP